MFVWQSCSPNMATLFFPPPSLLPTTTNHARHHCQQCLSPPLPFMTAHERQWPPMTAAPPRPPKKQRRLPTNYNQHPPHKRRPGLTNGHRRWQAQVSQLPLLTLHFIHTEYRCHVVVSEVAAKWRTTTLATSLLLILDTTVSIPCPTFIPIHLAETQDDNNQHNNATWTWDDDEDTRRGCGQDRRWRGQDDKDTWRWGHTATTIHGNNDAWWWQYTATRWRQHFPFHITPTPLPLTSPSL